MKGTLHRLPLFYLLAPIVSAAWFALRPLDLTPDWTEVGLAALNLAGATAGYFVIRRLGVPRLHAAWTLISLSVLVDFCGEFTHGDKWDSWVQTCFAVAGFVLLASGIARSHSIFRTEAEHAKQREEQYRHDANHDRLTGLANRACFLEELRARWHRLAPEHRSSIAVLFIDLDGFKAINDEHGHLVGDELLQIVARRLRAAVRQEDMVARVGGDEFAALITDVRDAETLEAVLERVQARLTRVANVNRVLITPTASIGVARGSEKQTRPKDLLRAADAAMYAAKRSKLDHDPSAAA